MSQIDWDHYGELFTQQTSRALRRFSQEHPNETISFCCFRSDYRNGITLLAIDTPSNSSTRAREEAEAIYHRQARAFSRPRGHEDARYYLTRDSFRLLEYPHNSEYFSYPSFETFECPEWERVFSNAEWSAEMDQFEGHLLVHFWKVVDRVVNSSVLQTLLTAAQRKLPDAAIE